ncbi:putative selenate ABC transporter substrate-binding protein [Lapillicoccus sp.]|uniref:putative selenate ABC transporter substrate-binding protein n=1 Tax=Lapillicoccus sp. TaxID=1909287 RepID=UPI0039830432
MCTSRRSLILGSGSLLLLAACSSESPGAASSTTAGSGAGGGGPLVISAIPDQDPAKLNRLYPLLATRLSSVTGLQVKYQPITDYAAVVRAFEVGDIGMSWMGGLTGVQARARVFGATAIAQRDIDAAFHSLFIANSSSGLQAFIEGSGLKALEGHSLTFGSETSTSGRLMPQYFMQQGGVDLTRLKGKPGFSGSHDATIEAVASGSFETGAVNEQVWTSTQKAGKVDISKVVVLWRTPGFADYHWLARPDLDQNYGAGTTAKITDALLGLKASVPEDKAILDLFGATSFITTKTSNYNQIETVAKSLGLLA